MRPKRVKEHWPTVSQVQHALLSTIAVTNLFVLAMVLLPSALATSEAPTPVNATTQGPSTRRETSFPRTSTQSDAETSPPETSSDIFGVDKTIASMTTSVTTKFFVNETTTSRQGLSESQTASGSADGAVTTVRQSEMPSSESNPVTSNQTQQPESVTGRTEMPTTKSFTGSTTALSNTPMRMDRTTEVTTILMTVLTTSFGDNTPPTVSITRAITASVAPDGTFASTSMLTTSVPTTSIGAFSTSSLTSPTQTSESATRSTQRRNPTTNVLDVTTQTVITTTGMGQSGSLTAEQWVGIGIAIAIVVALLLLACCLLVRLRMRNSLSKKPSIKVSKEEYAQSTTLERKKDPQWRKSLTIALHSMNAHIELPKETGEEMQAVDNLAFVDESYDPQTSNEDPSHLTKV